MDEIKELGQKLTGLREAQAKRFEEYKSASADERITLAKVIKDADIELASVHDKWVDARQMEEAQHHNEQALEEMKSLRKDGIPFASNDGRDGAKDEGEAAVKSTFPHGFKSLGQWFTDSEQFRANIGNSRARFGVDVEGITLSQLGIDGNTKATLTTTAGIPPYPPQQPDVVPIARQRPTIADLMPAVDTDAPSIIYLEQTTSTSAAAPVSEGGKKQESTLEWTRRTVPLEVIAHLLPITNQELEDIPSVRSIIDQELVALLRLAEENQILNGNGSSPQIQGLLTKTGVQTQAKGGDDAFTAAMKAFTKIRFTGFADVTAGVMHPNDWQDIVTTQDNTGKFIYGSPASAVVPRIWGVPIVVTTAVSEGTALFGDFSLYARIWRKGGIRVETGFVDDDFARNQQTIRCEERMTLQIRRPSAFCKLTGI